MKYIFAVFFILFSLQVANAQETTPRVEVFSGYSYSRATTPIGGTGTITPSTNSGSIITGSRADYNGFTISFTENMNSKIGLTQEFGGLYRSGQGSIYPYLFGPRFNLYHSAKFTPFVETLVGGAKGNGNSELLGASFPVKTDNSFALELGGGMDYKLNDKISMRLIQADYFQTHFLGNTQNNLKLSVGFILPFGKK
jgi:opacity protein-like surface antigen